MHYLFRFLGKLGGVGYTCYNLAIKLKFDHHLNTGRPAKSKHFKHHHA
jgi:hypothetical protein